MIVKLYANAHREAYICFCQQLTIRFQMITISLITLWNESLKDIERIR